MIEAPCPGWGIQASRVIGLTGSFHALYSNCVPNETSLVTLGVTLQWPGDATSSPGEADGALVRLRKGGGKRRR